MIKIGLKGHFDSAHYLRDYNGKCASLHGHTWNVEIVLCGETDNKSGMLLDFNIVKKLLNQETDKFDHKVINEIPPFDEKNPTAENLAKEFYCNLTKAMPANIKLLSVKIWESPNAWAEYSEN